MILERRKEEQFVKPDVRSLGFHDKTISTENTLEQSAALLERAREQIGREPRLDEQLQDMVMQIEQRTNAIRMRLNNPNEMDTSEASREDCAELAEAMIPLHKFLAEYFPRGGARWHHH